MYVLFLGVEVLLPTLSILCLDLGFDKENETARASSFYQNQKTNLAMNLPSFSQPN